MILIILEQVAISVFFKPATYYLKNSSSLQSVAKVEMINFGPHV